MQRAEMRQELSDSVKRLLALSKTRKGDECISNLTDQYIHGFDGDIDCILSMHSAPLQVQIAKKPSPNPLEGTPEGTLEGKLMTDWLVVNEATNLKIQLEHYRNQFQDTLKPPHLSGRYVHSYNDVEQVRFHRFMTLHRQCIQLMSDLERLFPDFDKRYHHILRGEIANFKFMMEQIAADIGYPTISNIGLDVRRCLSISISTVMTWNSKNEQQEVKGLKHNETKEAMSAIRNAMEDAPRRCMYLFQYLTDVKQFTDTHCHLE